MQEDNCSIFFVGFAVTEVKTYEINGKTYGKNGFFIFDFIIIQLKNNSSKVVY